MTPSPDLSATISVPARLMDVRRLAEHLRLACAAAAVDDMTAFDCELALVEAANNVVEHGYADRGTGDLTLLVQVGEDFVRMELLDRGTPVPRGLLEQFKTVPLEATEGRGTSIIQACVDVVDYTSEDGVNRLVMIKRLA